MSHETDKKEQRVVNLLALSALNADGWALERDNEDGGALVLRKGDRQIVGGFHCYVEPVAEESIITTENLVPALAAGEGAVARLHAIENEVGLWWTDDKGVASWQDDLNDGGVTFYEAHEANFPLVGEAFHGAKWVEVFQHEVDGCLTTEPCPGVDVCPDCIDVRKSVGEDIAVEGECPRCGSLPGKRDDTCPECTPVVTALPGQDTQGCSCGMADYGEPGHDGGPAVEDEVLPKESLVEQMDREQPEAMAKARAEVLDAATEGGTKPLPKRRGPRKKA